MESYGVCPIPRTRKRGFRTMRNNCKTQVKMASESKTDRPRCISDFLAMLCCLFYADFYKTTKDNSQKFIVSKMTRQHFTGNILTSHYDKYGRSCSGRNKRFVSDWTYFCEEKNRFHVILRGGSLDWLKQGREYFYFTA